jgi:hypothetical protein
MHTLLVTHKTSYTQLKKLQEEQCDMLFLQISLNGDRQRTRNNN